MFCIIFLILTVAFIVLLYVKSKGIYDGYIGPLDAKQYPLKRYISLGLKLMDSINYSYGTKYDSKIRRRLGELKGLKNADYYLKIHWASKVTYILAIMLIFSLFGSIIWLQEVYEESRTGEMALINGNELNKPAFGEGSREISLNADIVKGELKEQREYRVNIPEQTPPNDEAAVQKALDRLTATLIKGSNSSLDSVSSRLYLRNSYPELGNLGVSIEWRTSNADAAAPDGTVEVPEDTGKVEKVALTAVIKKGSISREKIFNIQVRKAPLTDKQAMEYIIQELEREIAGIKNNNDKTGKVALPTTSSSFNDAFISWFPVRGEKPDSGLSILVYALLMSGLIVYLSDNDINLRAERRKMRIRYHFPDFLNKLVLLINAGMTVNRAMEKIVYDNRLESPFYEELSIAMADIGGGKPEHQALEEFANRCKVPEISKFVSVLLQNLVKGNAELVSILLLLSGECWEMRKNAAKRMGEEASTKLLLPMMLMLVAILMIVVTPAVLSMNGL